MRLKYTYSFQEYDDRYLAIVDLSATDQERRMLWVNESGKKIMELLHNETSKEDLLRALTAQYSGDSAVIEAAADSFVDQLFKAGLLINI